MDYEKEIPFGAFDSELMHQEFYIPEGFEATIDGNKIILTKTESEDERIRKILINLVKNNGTSYYIDKIHKDDILAWLEKQGVQKSNKDEPKFKVGDWVVNKLGNIWHIDSFFDENNYQVTNNKGEYNYFPINIQNRMRPWTIQDAKDGDVLSYRDGQWIFVYKKCVDDNSFQYYALYSTIHQDMTIEDAAFTLLGDAITPATKEQRDLLFQKMKDAGYEWNAENLQLTKILPVKKLSDGINIDKQKAAEWSENVEKKKLGKIEDEEYNGEDYGIDGLWHAMNILEKTLGKVDGYQTDDGILEHKCAITAVKKLYEQKPTWSQEDREYMESLLDIINGTPSLTPSEVECHKDWLKNLKQRIGG